MHITIYISLNINIYIYYIKCEYAYDNLHITKYKTIYIYIHMVSCLPGLLAGGSCAADVAFVCLWFGLVMSTKKNYRTG